MINKKEHGAEYTDAEADEALNNLAGLFDILFRQAEKEVLLKKRLKKEPDGFPVDGHYSCMVCGNSITEETGWYHHGGPRCLICHRALITGVIPYFILENRDSYLKDWKLADAFKVRTVTIHKMVRKGELIARQILNDQGKVHEYIFLKKENPTLVERYSPARKSYDRNRKKWVGRWAREEIKVKDIDVRNYAKYILREGKEIEKRELLGCLRERLTLKNKQIILEKIA